MKSIPVFDRLFMRLSHSKRIDGLWLGVVGPRDKSTIATMKKVEAALGLIRQHDPLRYRRITRDLGRIWVIPIIGAWGQYVEVARMCRLDAHHVDTSPPESVASTIVHEATHAYPCLRKCGYPEALRYRIEQICMRQQVIFAEKLPNGTAAAEGAKQNMAREANYWTDTEFRARRAAQEEAAVKLYGMPRWVLTFSRAVGKLSAKVRQFRRSMRRWRN